MKTVTQWIGISGSWRISNPQIEKDVRTKVAEILRNGNGIITGGALHVDYQVTDEVLKRNKEQQLKIFLPTTLPVYAAYYRKRASEGIITSKQAEDLIAELQTFQQRNPNGCIENLDAAEVSTETYYKRNSSIVDASDALIVFQVNGSAGTQDAIDKAHRKGIPVTVFTYTIDDMR